MQCPYPTCRKDYNDEDWPKVMEEWLNPSNFDGSYSHEDFFNRLFVISRQCRFCNQYFHEILVGHRNHSDGVRMPDTLEPLISFPVSKTIFEAKNIPKEIVEAFNEAERCRAIGSLTGVGSCLRKTVYTLCDIKKVVGKDYKEKIVNLPVRDSHKELLKQIKWLGDNTTKPGEEKYDMAMVDVALEILPLLIDDMYKKEEKEDAAAKLLAKARSTNIIEKEN